MYEGFLSDMECDHLVSTVIFVTLLSQLIICICVIEAYLLMFSLSQGRGNMDSSLAFTDGDRNSSYNNIEVGLKVYLANSEVSIHPFFIICGILESCRKCTLIEINTRETSNPYI